MKRKGNAPAEATQELQSLDVLEIVETLKARPDVALPRKSLTSNSSIAPVGLDLAPERAAADEEVNPTMEIRLPARRRRLGAIVIGAIAGCALILVAAGIARVSHASSSPESTSTATPATPVTTTAAAPVAPPAPSPGTAATAAPATTSNASTGTVRLDRPARPGHVWLDGKKLSSTSALVSCGTHQIKVGRGRTHSVDVPCGSEIAVSK